MLYLLYITTALILFTYFLDKSRHIYVRIFSLYASVGCSVEMICKMYGFY